MWLLKIIYNIVEAASTYGNYKQFERTGKKMDLRFYLRARSPVPCDPYHYHTNPRLKDYIYKMVGMSLLQNKFLEVHILLQ